MRRVIYGMGVSLDGFIADASGSIDFTAPDEELHRFHNEQARATGVNVYGRRLYEVMRHWETAEEDESSPEFEREWAREWKADAAAGVLAGRWDAVGGGATLARTGIAETVDELRAQPGGDISIGGAGLAASFIALDLVDEYRLYVYPVLIGAGTPFFPSLDARLGLRLADTRGRSGPASCI